MIKYLLNLEKVTPLNRKQIEYLVQMAGKFSSRILLIHQCRTINGKSMLGLLSLGATGIEPVQVVVEGEDEERAAAVIRKILEEGVQSPKTAGDAEALLMKIKGAYADILGEKLAGLYVHGSLAFGCFNWEKSDIDLMLVLTADPGAEKKEKLCRVLYDLRDEAPPKGFEMCAVLEKDCRDITYPMPFVLHYSKMHEQAFAADPTAYVKRMKGFDPDIICHIAELKAASITLLGPNEKRMFSPVYRDDVLDAIRHDLENTQEELHNAPAYYILNLCRALAFARDSMMLSKRQGGVWGLQNLDISYQATIQAALNAYSSDQDMFYEKNAAEDLVYEYLPELGIEVHP